MVGIRAESVADLDRHGELSMAFEVRTVLDVELVEAGVGGLLLKERVVDEPWVKDHDAAERGPTSRASRLDVSNWGLLGAYENDRRSSVGSPRRPGLAPFRRGRSPLPGVRGVGARTKVDGS
jgi:hypothetical protein